MKTDKKAFLIILAGIFLRLIYLYFYKDYVLNWDELFPLSYSLSCFDYVDLIRKLSLEDCHPPLFIVISRFFIGLGHNRFLMLRIMNVVFSSFNLYLFYHLLKRYSKKKKVIYYALILMAFSPWMLKESVRVFRYTTFLTFILLTYISFYDLYYNRDLKNRIFYIVSTLLCFYTHYFSLFVIIPQVVLGLFRSKNKKGFFIDYVFISLLYLPFLLLSHSSPLNINFYNETLKGSIGWLVPVDFSDFTLRLLKNYLLFDSVISTTVIGIVLAIILVYFFAKSDYLIRSVFFVPPILLMITAFVYQSTFDQGLIEFSHFVFTIPMFFLAIAYFLEYKTRRILMIFLITIFVFTSLFHLLNFNGDELEYFIKDIVSRYSDDRTMIYIFPSYYRINAQFYMEDFPTRINIIPLKVDIERLKRSLDNDFYDRRLIFVKNMENNSLHHGEVSKLNDFLRSRKDLSYKQISPQVSLYFQPYDLVDVRNVTLKTHNPLLNFVRVSLGKSIFIMLVFFFIYSLTSLLYELFIRFKPS